MNDGRYKIEYERDMWGWTGTVYDNQAYHLVYYRVIPAPLWWVRRRAVKAIVDYERGSSYIAYSS